jgi:spore coat protein U-like protein
VIRRSLALLVVMLLPGSALAQSCNFSVSTLAFGSLDTLTVANTDMTATLAISCTGTALSTIRICPSIGAGSGGANTVARQMPSSSSTLNYQLYQDNGHSVIWGSYNWALPGTPPTINLTLGLGGTGSMNVTIFGRVFGSQGTATPGAYTSSFSATDDHFTYGTLGALPCPNVVAVPQHAHPTFVSNANVASNCNVAAQAINFGTQGTIGVNVDTTGGVTVSCTSGTTYNVGLDGGHANAGPSGRVMSLGAQTVSYGLYIDPARTLVWGNTIGSNTVAGTGSGSPLLIPVYARVPPQVTSGAGVYNDTIVVTITY